MIGHDQPNHCHERTGGVEENCPTSNQDKSHIRSPGNLVPDRTHTRKACYFATSDLKEVTKEVTFLKKKMQWQLANGNGK